MSTGAQPPRLHVVSGKGGTGKTTVAAALALALAGQGRRTLLCEVEGRQGIAQLFDVPQLPYAERRIATAPGGGEVFALAVEPKAALLEYLELFYHLGRAGKVLDKLGAVDFATTIAPGLRDVLLTGKVYEAVRRRRSGKSGPYLYDAVVLDAPPTGRIGTFLNVNSEVADLTKVGPISQQSTSIMSVLRSPTTVVHLVTLLEEMPVQETEDAVKELSGNGLRLGAVVLNQMRPPLLSEEAMAAATRGRLRVGAVNEALAAAGLAGRPGGKRYARGLIDEAGDHARRLRLEAAQRDVLDGLGLPLIELPALSGGIDQGALYEFAALLARSDRIAGITTGGAK